MKHLEKMSQKTGIPPSHRFTKSLPFDFRFMGSPTSDPIGYADVSSENNRLTSLSIPENGDSGDKVVERVENGVADSDQVNDDSPYSGNAMLVEDRPSVGDEDVDSAASLLPSVSKSNIDRRWSDITSYATKKVIYGSWPDIRLALLALTGFSLCYVYDRSLSQRLNYLISLFQKVQSWFQLPSGNWELGRIMLTSGTESVISLPDGKVSEY